MNKREIGERPRVGRPALPDELRAESGSIRLTPARWVKLRRLGRAWLSEAIDRAKEPAPKE